jgi:hypothetical protein
MAFYAVVDDFRDGMPQTILAGGTLRPRGIASHTTEGGEGEAGAVGTIVNVLIAMPERSASYHELWYPKADGFEARRIVRPEHASHSMNPRRPPWRDPPDPRVARILGDRWWDPNAASYAVSIAGSTGVTIPKLSADRGFMAGARRRYAELLAQFASSLAPDPLYNHSEGQSDRTDWGTFRAALLATPTQEDDMLLTRTWRRKRETWTTVPGAPFRAQEPGQGVIPKAWAAPAVELTTFLEETVIVNGAITTPTSRVLLALYPDPEVGPELLEIPRRSLTNPRPAPEPSSALVAALTDKIERARIPAAATVEALR